MTQKLKINFFFHFMTTIYNFALKMETSLAKSVVKAILETKNANNFIVYICFIYLFLKKNSKTAM